MEQGHYELAKKYILYRQKHKERRDARDELMNTYEDIFFAPSTSSDFRRENANINTDSSMGIMLKLGTEGAKQFVDNYILKPEVEEAHRLGFIHYHDKDFSIITSNCLTIDLLKLMKGGFSTGHGHVREPNSIRSAASIACIAIQSSQNDFFGGQAIAAFDFAMAYYVRKSFVKALKKNLKKIFEILDIKNDKVNDFDFETSYKNFHEVDATKLGIEKSYFKKAYKLACSDVEDETLQAMEALIHNLNTLHSRCGSQTPFSSLNYGVDTSPEGQLVIDKLLDATWDGLGNGETPIFPIQIFQLKTGYSYKPEDPNYYLFTKACKVSAKRLFPNFLNEDSSFNAPYFKEGNYNSLVCSMGCRTRVMGNVNGPEESGSRGNFAFITLNLPMIALEAKGNLDKFWKIYDHYIKLSHDALLDRLEIIKKKHVYNLPFAMGQGLYMGSENLKSEDTIWPALKHASISIGYIGLAECLVALIGKHHGESDEAQELGLKIIGHLREKTDKYKEKEHLNWSTFASPAEGFSGRSIKCARKRFGIVEGVTSHSFTTNGNHLPVYFNTSAINKIRKEAPYHRLADAGNIAYIEMDGDPTKNVKAFQKLVCAMHDADMGYYSIK